MVTFAFSSGPTASMEVFPRSMAVLLGAIPLERRIMNPSLTTESSHRLTIWRSWVRKKSTCPCIRAIATSMPVIIGYPGMFALVIIRMGWERREKSRWCRPV